MVHALEEIRRVLTPAGCLIDLRPLAASWAVEVVSGGIARVVGRLTDDPEGPALDRKADQAIQKSAKHGWFRRESMKRFPFHYYWDSPEEMEEFIREEWSDFIQPDEALFAATKRSWEAAGSDRRLRVAVKMHIARWRAC